MRKYLTTKNGWKGYLRNGKLQVGQSLLKTLPMARFLGLSSPLEDSLKMVLDTVLDTFNMKKCQELVLDTLKIQSIITWFLTPFKHVWSLSRTGS